MNPDFVSVGVEATVAEALAAVRASELGAQLVSTICLTDDAGLLVGRCRFPTWCAPIRNRHCRA